MKSNEQNLVWWSQRYCIYFPLLRNLYLFYHHCWTFNWWYIFIDSHQLVGPLPIRRPFNVMVWFHFSLLCKKNVRSEPTIQTLLKSIDPKTLSQYSGIWKRFYNWINISENACEMNISLMCDFLTNMYNRGYSSVSWT